MGSFFRNQTFPQNWHRRAVPGDGSLVARGIALIHGIHPEIVPGANNADGVYVPDNVTEFSDVGPFLNQGTI
jgi:hypothetical protein